MLKKVLFAGTFLLGLVIAIGAGNFAGQAEQPNYITHAIESGSVSATVTATGTVNAVVTVEVGSQLSGQISEIFVDYNDHVHRFERIAEIDARSLVATVKELEAELEVARTNVEVEQGNLRKANATLEKEKGRGEVFAALSASKKALLEEAERKLNAKRILRKRKVVSVGEMETSLNERDSTAALLRASVAEQKIQASTIRAAEADVSAAEARIANAKALVKQKWAALSRARVNLESATIRSPIDGIIVGRNVVPGQTVAASFEAPTLFTIAEDLDKMEVHAKIDEADIGRIRPNQYASFIVDAFPGHVFQGRVTQIRKAPEELDNVVTYTVVIATSNPQRLLLPGMTALLKITVGKMNNVLLLPNSALRFQPSDVDLSLRSNSAEETYGKLGTEGRKGLVWVLGPRGSPEPLSVRTGITDGFNTALLAGSLREGQEVIVAEPELPVDNPVFNFRLKF